MPRMRPETVLLQAEDVLGRVPAEERAQTLSNTIGKLLDAVDDASQGLRFEAEPPYSILRWKNWPRSASHERCRYPPS